MFMVAIRAAMFDERLFNDMRERQETMFSALGIVLVGGIAFALGIWSEVREPGAIGFQLEENLILFMCVSTIFTSWFVWAVFVWLLGIRLFQGRGGYRTALRTLGICYAPLALCIFLSFIPAFIIAAPIWVMVAGTVAVKHTLGLAWWKAAVSTVVGWVWGMVVVPAFILFPYITGGA